MNSFSNLIKETKLQANLQRAKTQNKFFKTKKGEYGEGMKFLGIAMANLRQLSKKYETLNLIDIEKLLKNEYHEIQIIALLLLVNKYKRNSDLKDEKECLKIYKFYLTHTKYINSWGLVDISAHYIIGNYLLNKNKKVLERLAKSKDIWERRIAIVSTFAFIKEGKSQWTFKIIKILLKDQEGLINKACGWMLREVGKQVSTAQLRAFLDTYGPQMPRVMFRYAIERFPENERKYYLNK